MRRIDERDLWNRLRDDGNSWPGEMPSWKGNMVETKLKNSKVNVAIFVTDDYPESYREGQGYNWFSGS
jgi:hypothetical protein